MNRLWDQDLTNLVDAVVEVADSSRQDAIDRVREALAAFDAAELLDAELRLNARPSSDHVCIICGFDEVTP